MFCLQELHMRNLHYVLCVWGLTVLLSSISGAPATAQTQSRTSSVQQSVKKISGHVKDASGEVLAGVNVFLKGTQTGTTTDFDGRYSLEMPSENVSEKTILVFSFLGMKQLELPLKGRTTINAVMQEDEKQLEDAVVTGYQTLRKKDMAGSYTTVKADDIMMPAMTSIDQMLQGRVAGLVVTQTSSRVGTTPEMKLRGTSTIMGATSPLWVVDGVIQPDPLSLDQSALMTDDIKTILGNQISWLNPSDIETITVLKDASATAIYGSKASNGVIVITTKQGRNGRVAVKYTGNVSVRARPNYGQFNLMNSQERIRFSQEAFESGSSYSGNRPPIKQLNTFEGLYRMYLDGDIGFDEYSRNYNRLETVNTDWFKLLTRTSVSHNHNLSVSGGSDKVVYNASVAYGSNRGVEIGNDADNMSGRLRVGANLRHNLRIDVSLIGSIDKTDGYGPGINPMDYATTTSRAIPVRNEDGKELFYRYPSNYPYGITDLDLGYNILNEIANSSSNSRRDRLNATLDLNWDILPWLTYQFTGGITSNNSKSEIYAGEKTYYIANKYRGYDYGAKITGDPEYNAALLPFGGELQSVNTRESNYNFQNKILFRHTFKEKHRINAMLGLEIRSTQYASETNTVWGYMPERGKRLAKPTLPDNFVSMGTSSLPPLGLFENLYNGRWVKHGSEENYLSYFATLSYTFNDRYVLNASIRNDESNRFGQDVNRRFDPLYSFAVSWDIADEPFVKDNVRWIDQLRLRASYGVQGNTIQSISPDLIVTHQGVISRFDQYGISIRSLPNPELTWESTQSWNFGLDMQLFKWATMSLEYYRRASDAVVYQSIAREYGMATMALNGGRISNNGVEFMMNITPIMSKNWSWTVGFNVSKNWNKALNLDSSEMNQLADYIYGNSSRILKKGYPLSGFWSYSFKGLNQETGYPEFNLPEGTEMDPTNFLVYSGQSDSPFTSGFNTRLRFREFSFGADFVVLLGRKTRLPNPFTTQERLPSPYTNMDRELLNRWKKPGDDTNIPAFYAGKTSSTVTLPNGNMMSMYDMWGYSDIRVVDGSFLRCSQLSLSWTADQKVCSALHLSDLTLSLMANNVFVVCDKRFNGFDPELGNSVMPLIFTFGLNIGF